MEILLAIVILVVVYLAEYSRRTRNTVECLAVEIENQQIRTSALRTAYIALFEEVRNLRRETKNEE